MIRPNVDLECHKYKISDLTFTYDGLTEPIVISNNLIKSLMINNDYDNTVTASYMLSLTVPNQYYNQICSNMNTLTVTFTISKCFLGLIKGTEEDEYENKLEQNVDYARLTLKAINDQELGTSNISRIPDTDDVTVVDEGDSEKFTGYELIGLNLYLYDADKMEKYKKNKSFIIGGGLNDVIYQLFVQRGFKDLLIDTTANEAGIYTIPYGNLGENLTNLNGYYGIYDYPFMFYMDAKRNYLINKGNLGRCVEKGELGSVNIYLERLDSPGAINVTGCYADEENKIYVLNAGSFAINDNDSAIDYIAGGNITTVIRGTGEIKHDKIGTYDIDRSYVVDNNKQHSQLIYTIKESKRSLNMVFENVELGIFTPNKSYAIISDPSYYNKDFEIDGKYRLAASKIVINKQGENEFKLSNTITLVKSEK